LHLHFLEYLYYFDYLDNSEFVVVVGLLSDYFADYLTDFFC